jgi:diguanylate cyclase (GGDEF)-like protein/hemerythrin-like metal-binding protein/PAS domain S-box-containing protein
MTQKPAVQWHATLSTGIRSIDQQHEEMFARVNELIHLHRAGQSTRALDELLPSLTVNILFHFSEEEVLLAQVAGGSEFERQHWALHHAFTLEIDAICQCRSTQSDPQVAEKLSVYLAHWLIEHIRHADQELARRVFAQEATPAWQPKKNESTHNPAQMFLDSCLDAVVQIDAAGRITASNHACEHLFGWSSGEVVGKVFCDTLLVQRHRASQKIAYSRIVLPGQPSVRMEVEGLHRLGKELPIELTLTAVQTKAGVLYCAFIRDNSERRKLERDLNLARSSFESLEGMVIIDTDMTILKVNVAFSNITGYSAAEAVGKKSAILHANVPDLMAFWALTKRAPVDMFWRGEVADRRKNGETYAAHLSVMAVANKQNRVTHFVLAFGDLSESRKTEDRLHRLSFYDPLTDLPNRFLLLDRLQQALIACDRNKTFGAVLLVDLDDFKSLNEALGHQMGDLMLIQVAQRIKACLHATDTLARLAGDTFVVVLEALGAPQMAAAARAERVASRIIEAFAQPFDLQGHKHPASASIGIRLFEDLGVDASALVSQAEAAMYRAKEAGCNEIRFFDSSTQVALQTRFMLTEWMRQGLPDQFTLHYQVQTDHRGLPFGAEALVRWQHPEQGAISPAMFIPLAEETGFIIQVGAWVLRRACEQLVLWSHNPAMCHLTLSVNVSAKQFHQKDFAHHVVTTLAQTGANPALLELELTEGMMVRDVEAVIEKMQVLKGHGVRFSLDDFGTGYSSLSYLKRFPLDQLKIDQSFVRGVINDPSDAAIVRAVITMGRNLGLAVIAEGVETSEQWHFLQTNGCQEFQGYLFGKPLDLAAFEAQVGQLANV